MTDNSARAFGMTPDQIEQKTKQIYLDQHSQYLKDPDLFNRFYEYAVNPDSYALTPESFKGATVLDAGCGNSAYFQKAMYDLGSDKISCVDLGTEWIPLLESALRKLDLPLDKFECRSGSTTAIPYPDDHFDIVASNGVLMHLPCVDDAISACHELYRVTKPGGSLYIYFGVDKPGIVDTYIVPALRQAYVENADFRDLVDNCTPLTLKQNLQDAIQAFATHDACFSTGEIQGFLDFITLDTSTFLKNMLQVPVQQGNFLDYDFAVDTLGSLGAINIRRCPQHYFRRKDIRRFLTPLHFTSHKNNLSNIFYGGGHLKITCDKPIY